MAIFILNKLNWLLNLVGLRRNQKFSGVVYDSQTKQPIDPAVVKLIPLDSELPVQSCITDLKGRYGFLAVPGTFKIFVYRPNYKFPSELQKGLNDGIYDNLYHGEFFELTGDSDIIAFNIPLDPVNFDWNQQAKSKYVKFSPVKEYFLNFFLTLLFWVGLFYSLWQYYQLRSLPAGRQASTVKWVLIAYAIIIFLAWVLPQVRLWGRVKSRKTGKPLANVVIEISHAAHPDVVVGSAVTSLAGKFFIRVNKGNYIMNLKQKNQAGEWTVIKSLKISPSSEGVINKDIVI